MPCLLYWDPNDDIVRFQDERQCGLLYRLVKMADPDAPVEARTHSHGHWWISHPLALDWLIARIRE